MNLFYICGNTGHIVNSDLACNISDFQGNTLDGISVEGNILWIIGDDSDGNYCLNGTVNPLGIDLINPIRSFLWKYTDICSNGINVCAVGLQNNDPIGLFTFTMESYRLESSTTSWNSVVYGKNKFITVGINIDNKLEIAISLDGFTYDSFNEITETSVLPKITFGNDIFIICSNALYKSIDGDIWESIYNNFTSWIDVNYNSNGFLAINGTQSASSIDGITWEIRILPTISGVTWQKLTSNGDVICMSFYDGIQTMVVIFSQDNGVTWSNSQTLTNVNGNIFALHSAKFWNLFKQSYET